MRCETYDIRAARPADIPAIRAMQGRSMRALGAGFYPEAVIAAFLERIGTMDDAVVHEGYFLVADAGGTIVGSGGWSRLTPGYARTAGAAALVHDATIRSVFVDQAAARRGIASAIMARAESRRRRRGRADDRPCGDALGAAALPAARLPGGGGDRHRPRAVRRGDHGEGARAADPRALTAPTVSGP